MESDEALAPKNPSERQKACNEPEQEAGRPETEPVQSEAQPAENTQVEDDLTRANLRRMLEDERLHLENLRAKQRGLLQSRLPRAFGGKTSLASKSEGVRPEYLGVALSGGGIRSATFSLGIIQALAQRKRIESIDYISTVSGGGYIGTWLSACIYRARLAGNIKDPVHDVELRITPQSIRHAREETAEIRFLRAYSNYLTPRLGLLGGDTLAALSGFLRNLCLNLFLGILATLFLLALFHALIALAAAIFMKDLGGNTLFFLTISFGLLSFFLTLQSHDLRTVEDPDHKQRIPVGLQRGLVLASTCFTLFMGSIWIGVHAKDVGLFQFWLLLATVIFAMLCGSIATYVFLSFHRTEGEGKSTLELVWSSIRRVSQDSRNERNRYLIASMVCAAGTFGAGFLLVRFMALDEASTVHVVALGPTVGVIFLWFLFILWTGVLGTSYSEFTREWLNRFLGEMSGLAALWMVASVFVVHARPVWYWTFAKAHDIMQQHPLRAILAILLAISLASATIWISRRLRVPPAEPESETKRPITMILCWIFVGAFIFMLTVVFQDLLLFSIGDNPATGPGDTYAAILQNQIESLRSALSMGSVTWTNPKRWLIFWPAMTVLILVATVTFFSFLFVDVNTFSLQNLYRNRLVRCYLGAAHGKDRLPNPYAGFDPRDDFALAELADQRPYLLVNAALNITQGQDLAWQQRKAGAFLFSPRWCGYWLASTEMSGVTDVHPKRGGYVRTDQYVHESGGFRNVSKGVMVGTAIASSGAAVSSQMGFASRGPLAFVLTLLNLRLGRWLPNTAPTIKAEVGTASPWFGAFWYLRELLGTTNEQSKWIYISDGGHFENLGIYELVRRRCTRILCVDAGADPKRTFADLGNAVQKCRVDLGVDIKIDLSGLRTDPHGFSKDAFSIGTIEYPATRHEEGFEGEFVYVKPSLPSSWQYLPTDILAYRARHPEFPHEATTNQWFSESQFESYRHLGHVIGLKVLSATDGWRGPRGTHTKRSNDSGAAVQPGADDRIELAGSVGG